LRATRLCGVAIGSFSKTESYTKQTICRVHEPFGSKLNPDFRQ
jgi:hypothetical protein